jgi:hypothetical protein
LALGVKVTSIWHDPPGATADVHRFVAVKSPAFVPLTLTLCITNGVRPTFVTWIVFVVMLLTL